MSSRGRLSKLLENSVGFSRPKIFHGQLAHRRLRSRQADPFIHVTNLLMTTFEDVNHGLLPYLAG